MSKDFALLVDYKYCSGCHSCEVACKNELGLPVGKFGIRVLENKPQKVGEGVENAWDWDYVPVPTGLCNHCEPRVREGKKPSCVKHCQSFCMSYGTLEEMQQLAAAADHKVAIYRP